MNNNNDSAETVPRGYKYYHVVAMIFVVTLVVSNTIAVKIILVGTLTLPAGIIMFPIAYLAGDVLTEVYGFKKTKSIIWWGFVCLAVMSLSYFIATKLTPAPFWIEDDIAFKKLFGLVPRITLASMVAYLLGEFLNSMVLSKMKIMTSGKHFGVRAITSTVVGQSADSLCFSLIAFAGVFPMSTVLSIAVSGFLLKTLYEVIALPATCAIVPWLKREEGGVDVYDHDISYNPFGTS